MRTLDELVIAITLGTSEASEAEAAFADYLAEQLEARIKASLRELHALDMSELETWLGDDDPGGTPHDSSRPASNSVQRRPPPETWQLNR